MGKGINMVNKYNYQQQLEKLVSYFKNGEKREDEFKIGLEVEHLVLEKRTLNAVSYFGNPGVETILQQLLKKGWQPLYEGEYLLGLKGNKGYISLEPGGQMEYSIFPVENILDIEEAYLGFLKEINPLLDNYGMSLMAVGYQPESSINDISLLPKKRYAYMYDYFKNKGKYAHHMMKGTASIQVNLDYSDEEDYIMKMRVANYLAPLIYTFFDNTPFFEGTECREGSMRFLVWDNCDSDRCGLIEEVFKRGFGYQAYAEYLLNAPAIITKKNGQLTFTGSKLVREVFDPETFSKEELQHLLSMFFPDIRTKSYLEIRMGDSLTSPYSMGYVAFWKGLLYSKENLSFLAEEANKLALEEHLLLRKEMKQKGLRGTFHGQKITDKMRELFEMARSGLQKDEKGYILPLEELLHMGINPKFKTLNRITGGKVEALSWCFIL
jgi:glutamate--cysteine ligase